MPRYWISFRVDSRGNAGLIRKDLYEAARALAEDRWWVEPTSFMMFESEYKIDTIAEVLSDQIRPDLDLVVIGCLDLKVMRILGRVYDPDIFKMVPFAMKR